jgi:hypothetical protein
VTTHPILLRVTRLPVGRRASGFVLVAQGGLKHPPWRRSASSGIGFDSQSVVHRNPELLLASELALGRLDGDVAEQELDLIQLATRDVAKPGAGAPQVVRASFSMPARVAAARTTSQSTFGDMPSPQTRPALLIARKTVPSVTTAAALHASMCLFTHAGMGTVRTCPPFPTRSAMTLCSSRC